MPHQCRSFYTDSDGHYYDCTCRAGFVYEAATPPSNGQPMSSSGGTCVCPGTGEAMALYDTLGNARTTVFNNWHYNSDTEAPRYVFGAGASGDTEL